MTHRRRTKHTLLVRVIHDEAKLRIAETSRAAVVYVDAKGKAHVRTAAEFHAMFEEIKP